MERFGKSVIINGHSNALLKILLTIIISVLMFERLRVDEPKKFLLRPQVFADIYIRIDDELLIGTKKSFKY